MKLNNIKRNQLDYILTDVLPTELSEQFTYRYFYEYLNKKDNQINSILKEVIKQKNKNNIVFKGNNWKSIPLRYTIMKQLHTERAISLLQPLAAIQLFLFISAYQKEMLNILKKNSVFSIRFHSKNNDLYYKNKNKSIIKYFNNLSDDIGQEIIEQTGIFFNIGPYKSIASFTSSENWFVMNSKYKYFVRTDYKACFDSIYTHTFNWIIGKDINDTKKFRNGSIYTAIDEVLMNINARTSNGIVVGPEFSRMVAELLLQTIDKDVFCMLLNKNIIVGENYNIYRFVDDIFIFADSEQLANEIIELYSKAALKYLLRLNESKLYKNNVPFVLENWLNETNFLTNRVSTLLFHSKAEQKALLDEQKEVVAGEKRIKPYLIKKTGLSTSKKTIMNQFNELICKYESKNKTIVAYFLGTILNKVARNKDSIKIFSDGVSHDLVLNFLDLTLYIYSFFPNYINTQRLLSIISYVRDEFDIFEKRESLQELFDKYSFVFEKANLNDIINLILFYHQAQIEIPYRQEEIIVNQLEEKDDPILWASYLLYSKYSQNYFTTIKNKIGMMLHERIEAIVKKENIYTYREFWWVLIFNKSPFITAEEQAEINKILPSLSGGTSKDTGILLGDLFVDYIKNNPNQFFDWDINNKDFLRNLTFKTRQRSIFKNYRESLPSLYWSSI